MPNIEWEIPFVLSTPEGDLHLNACQGVYEAIGSTSGYQFKPIHTDCYMTPGANQGGLRVAHESIPQADGTLIHRRFKWGYEIQLKLAFWFNDSIALLEDRRVMWDHLTLHVNAIMNDDGRLRWLPSSLPDVNASYRMVDNLRLLAWPTPAYDGSEFQTVFQMESPFPYGLDYQEIDTAFVDGVPQTLNNTGNADMFPVWRVQGATSGFTIANLTTGLEIDYSDSFPGANPIPGGHYVEIDTFRNTVYLDGNGANEKAGIDVLGSDFWPLVPGNNDVVITGADATLLWQAAWA